MITKALIYLSDNLKNRYCRAGNMEQDAMQMISFTGLSGGVGRTTTLLSLAPMWLSAGQRIAVLNCAWEEAMIAWEAEMNCLGVGEPDLKIVYVRGNDELINILRDLKEAGFDKVLVDLPAAPSQQMFEVLGVSDLVVACLRDIDQATRTSLFLEDHAYLQRAPVGLFVQSGPDEDYSSGITRKAFTAGPCLVNEVKFMAELRAMFSLPSTKHGANNIYAEWITALLPHVFSKTTRRRDMALTDEQIANYWSLLLLTTELETIIDSERLKKQDDALEDAVNFNAIVDKIRQMHREMRDSG